MKRDDYQFNRVTPAFFVQGPSLFARFVFLAILAIALIVTDSRLQYLKSLRADVEAYLHPLSLMTNAPFEVYASINGYFKHHDQLVTENKVLRNQLLKAKVDVQSLQMLQVENQQLRELSHLEQRYVHKQILAEILQATSKRSIREIVINRGKAHQVQLGAAVLDGDGVIGQVTSLYPQTSLVTLITNPGMEIPVMVARNGLRAIAFGRGQNNQLQIPFLPANIDIKIGDRLITSGIDEVYPAGYTIGEVKKITVEAGAGYIRVDCSVDGGVDFNRHVIVVNPSPASSFSQLVTEADDSAIAEELAPAETAKPVKKQKQSYMSQGEIRGAN